ncbi:tetratricopeptide repeat protein 12 isoform X2 [Trichomycterus rosablanca]|uniref:tetratricopeptide repeat protein 12 isoform X2 n=1 Tax=Trichomycterus rosablanca TaxID=2290929 RepID=UPI002F34FCCB
MELYANEKLETFLRNVDHTSELVMELNSTDTATHEKAVERADRLVASMQEEKSCKSVINRTVINNSHSSTATCEPGENPEIFMKALEHDAEERKQRRQIKEKKASALKDKGNKAFAVGDFESAVRAYTEGLEQLRDMQVLYTNRAQAFIRLNKFKEAISDCEWALKCNDKCIKAYVLMGKAHLALRNFTESRQCYEKIMNIAPEREGMVKDYLTRVELEQRKTLQEEIAQQELKEGKEEATRVPDLLRNLAKSNELNLYYCGGVELLTQAIRDSTGQAIFRLNNGFSIITGNDSIRRCLAQTSKEASSDELCVSVLRLWRTICNGNEENQQLLLDCLSTREQIVQLLTSRSSAVQQECLALLCVYSHTQHGRRVVMEKLNLYRMVENLMECIHNEDAPGIPALAVLENLAGEKKFRTQFRETFTEVFAPPFEHLLEHFSVSSQDLLLDFISVVGAMSLDEVISKNMASRKEFWRSSSAAMVRCASCEYRSILYPLLGLMINTASNPAPAIQEYAVESCSRCVVLLSDPDGGIITRAVGLLSVMLLKSSAATHEVVQQGVVKKLLKILKGAGPTSSRYSIKALAVCTASSKQVREELLKLDKKLMTVRKLLASTDELVVGNAALCLGHCLEVQGAAAGLLGTDCLPNLLRHAADGSARTDVQKNAAIALGKLCKADPRHMEKLRELHGLKILHSCMKLI